MADYNNNVFNLLRAIFGCNTHIISVPNLSQHRSSLACQLEQRLPDKIRTNRQYRNVDGALVRQTKARRSTATHNRMSFKFRSAFLNAGDMG
ncbi:hypothetical protein DXH95_09540 [Sphingorhabdus pulchriflava]|uniref:Uncharacterized protein n=1 Tax=Sphingorhabdus pulchriflava TaxID=2292257 RepID=A0A371BJ15_9SPHN|nr:hypothetical protein DXH95_09540 [Sphingorhabdus pulchriflava]